ncbi:choice-of-anchor M domain-containing protein [Phytohabitans sp. ZYX-F-186]|uniref:Choice-of-anchor M domain-containing protein n=1 Tax=Phytohabitans maris TaxID=3071409 RepID=A0ABU0ZUU7_9ACTN|nr:choice-of-anchor M domain-containing protein [Phytohabitans sp. ZYX-F-186]MDQ7909950.1 choice-of-anchor M domain-containing protein [Phytohabitans sp. ZYX-F-186]
MPAQLGIVASRRRLVFFLVAALLGALAAFTVVPTGPAAAADGPAPPPRSLSVIADVHTDAIATFWDDGQLTLATKADIPQPQTRYEADDVWFHVDDDSRIESFPAGYDFVAPAGSTVWLAPEVQQSSQIWPGFSTESVPAGTLDGDDTTLTLVGVDGPGEVELWQSGSFGAYTRLWSSDEAGYSSFTRERVHMHANWAFTAAGTYHLTVRADAAVGGAAVSDTAVYTFVVGGLPADVDTTTGLEASDTSLVAGDAVTLTAGVSPAGVAGFVEFRDGTHVLGHTAVDAGRAEMAVPGLAVGAHDVTAVFVPAVENLANTSTSAPVTITVTDGSGVPFGIAGVERSYEVGDVLRARVAGHTLAEGESYQWSIRPVGTDTAYLFTGTGGEAAQGRVEQLLDARHDGYEIQARLRQGSTVVSETPWVALSVADAVEPVSTTFPAGPHYLGDELVFPIQGGALAEGDTVTLVYRFSSPWFDVRNSSRVGDTIVARPPYAIAEAQFAVQVVRDGVVLAQSDPVAGSVSAREVLVQGVQGVYRVGQTLSATTTVYPPSAELTYRWSVQNADNSRTTLKEGTTPDALTLELPMTMELHDRRLYFHAVAFYAASGGTPSEIWAGSWSTILKVSDSDPSQQLLFFENLSDHYHQGNQIDLNLVADPPLADSDTIAWQWQWPGTEWAPLPGAAGLSHTLTAEQALDGVQVRATLTFSDSGDTLVADPVTIHVDDHGAAARQQPAVGGATAYTEGDTVTLTRQLPENGPTVLTDHRWEKKAAGTEDWSVVDGATGTQLTFPAALADDGAQYRVSILKPGGGVAYGPSPAVELQVEQGSGEPADPVATTVTAGAVTQVYGKKAALTVAVSPGATGSVELTLPGTSRKLTGTLVDGQATITLPAKLLKPGKRTLSISYPGVAGEYQPSTGTAVVTVVKATPKVKVTADPAKVQPGQTATFTVTVNAAGVTPTGVVTVTVAGKTKAAVLNQHGQATVRITLPPRTPIGAKAVTVSYLGDRYVAKGETATTIRVVR